MIYIRTTLQLCVSILAIALILPQALANVVGSDAQNFNPTTNGLDFVTVQSSETLEPGIFNFGFFLNHAVNTLPYYPGSDQNTPQSRTDFNDYFFASDLNVGLGLAPGWDVGISIPYLLDHRYEQDESVGHFSARGFTEIRVNTKVHLGRWRTFGFATIVSSNFNRIRNNPYAGDDPDPTVNVEFAADTHLGKWAVASNIGYRFRQSGAPLDGYGIDPMPSQWIGSMAASYHVSSLDTKVIIEMFGSYPSESKSDTTTDRDYSSLELLAGVKHDWTSSVALHAGAGTELVHGAASPDWRVYAGMNWTFGPVFDSIGSGASDVQVESNPEYDSLSLANLNFESGKAELVEESKRKLASYTSQLKKLYESKPFQSLVVEGHTDSVGSSRNNQKLSQARANTVANYLRENLDIEVKVEAIGYGEARPIADNGNYQGRARNRRVEIKIYR